VNDDIRIDRRRTDGQADSDELTPDDVLFEAIARLPEAAPARDLWPAVRARIARTDLPQRPRWTITFTMPQLAMAATLLAAVGAGVSYVASSRPGGSAFEVEAPVVAQQESLEPADVQPANFADAQFDAAVTDLERILREDRDALDPRTVRVIERNLTAIDQAIRDARSALAQDPANPYLNSHLADARRRKLDLLRRATFLTTAGGD
jgi:hypothetical protein